MANSSFIVSAFAPPCSGPFNAPIAPTIAECMSDSVEAITRAANVLAFSSWSACRIRATSSARTAVSDGFTPFSMRRKFARVRQVAVRVDDRLAFADAVEDGHDHGDLRGQPVALAHIRFVRRILLVRVVQRQQAHRRAQHLHRRGVRGHAAQEVVDAPVQRARRSQLLGELRQLRRGRQLAEPQQIGGLLEVRVLREFMDIDAAVSQHAGCPVYPAD